MEEPQEKQENKDEYIHKKLAAIEAHKRSRSAMFISILGIAGVVVPLVFNTISTWAGSGAAIIFAGMFALLAVRNIKDVKYLEDAYDLGKKKVAKKDEFDIAE